MVSSNIVIRCLPVLSSLLSISSAEAPYWGKNESENPLAKMEPHYNPHRWPMTVDFIQDSDEEVIGACQQFPELGGGQDWQWYPRYYDTKGSAFCQTSDAINVGVMGVNRFPDQRYVKTTDDCYVRRELLYEIDNSTEANSLDELPWCGPLRPWMVTEMDPEYVNQGDGGQQWMNCWMEPDINSTWIKSDWYYPHVDCWVNGTSVGTGPNPTLWWESAFRLKTGEKCYFPYETSKGSGTPVNDTVGSPAGPCSDWDFGAKDYD